AFALPLDADPLEHLHAMPGALDHLEVDAYRIPRLEFRHLAALAVLDVLNHVHGATSSGRGPRMLAEPPRPSQIGPAAGPPPPAVPPPQGPAPPVLAGRQPAGPPPATEVLGPGVVRVLEAAVERLRERLLHPALGVAQRSRQLAGDGVDHCHCGDLASR